MILDVHIPTYDPSRVNDAVSFSTLFRNISIEYVESGLIRR